MFRLYSLGVYVVLEAAKKKKESMINLLFKNKNVNTSLCTLKNKKNKLLNIYILTFKINSI